jgi:hypothetical protein
LQILMRPELGVFLVSITTKQRHKRLL